MIGSFAVYISSGIQGAVSWGVTWEPVGEIPVQGGYFAALDEGFGFTNVGLTGKISVGFVGGPGIFPNPGPYPNTTLSNPFGPYGPFTLKDGGTYYLNIITGQLTEKGGFDIGTLLTTLMPFIMFMIVTGMIMSMTKGLVEPKMLKTKAEKKKREEEEEE